MAPTATSYAYKETRLNLDSTTPGSTVIIRLPAPTTSTWPLTSPQKRTQTTEVPVAEDEATFRQRYLAASASIYHRQYHTSPGSFLWRVLEGGKVLSICAVDISRQTTAADWTLTLRLVLPSPIRPGCIAFADSEQHDVLSAFVLLETNQLYTLTLRPDFFRKASSTEDNVADWCKIILPTAYATKQIPHRLAALSADEVLIANYDGGLTRLVKNSGGDGEISRFWFVQWANGDDRL
jgi:nuclear pore complex protein Nup160